MLILICLIRALTFQFSTASNIADSHNFLRLTQWQQRSGTIRVVVRVRPMFAPGTVQSSFLWLPEYHQNVIYHYPGPVAISGHSDCNLQIFGNDVCNSLIMYLATVHMLATNLRVLQVSRIRQNKRNLLWPWFPQSLYRVKLTYSDTATSNPVICSSRNNLKLTLHVKPGQGEDSHLRVALVLSAFCEAVNAIPGASQHRGITVAALV